MQRVTNLIRHILLKQGVFVLNYIDNIIGITPDDVANVHFKITLNLLNSLGFNLSNSKTLLPSKIPLGIKINLNTDILQILLVKIQDIIVLCHKFIKFKYITKNGLQAVIDSLIFIHKAIRPARVFINWILNMLRNMGQARRVAIDQDTMRDLRLFIACAHAVNGTVFIAKGVHSCVHITVDASLQNLGGTLGNRVVYCSLGGG
jgi:hypothetical protein